MIGIARQVNIVDEGIENLLPQLMFTGFLFRLTPPVITEAGGFQYVGVFVTVFGHENGDRTYGINLKPLDDGFNVINTNLASIWGERNEQMYIYDSPIDPVRFLDLLEQAFKSIGYQVIKL